ncbi:MAG: cysteine desulfurase [Planctomycetes bacterium]|nr:cysteine desulfurase [Planctomycetota bacterium]
MTPLVARPAALAEARPRKLDVARIREDFPILKRLVHGKRLVYLDNAATTQKPERVIEAIGRFYRTSNANIHRGIHKLAEEATAAYEGTRKAVARLLGGADPRGVVFTRNCTEALNLVAYAWGRHNVRAGDEILVTEMEHHSNLVPWIILAKEKGAVLKHIPLREDGTLRLEALDALVTPRTKIVSVMMVSNALGTINPVGEIAAAARRVGAKVVLDAAQAIPHLHVEVGRLDFDFLAFSAHKMMGPTGVGVLYAKPDLLRSMEPFLGGGEMIREVRLDGATWNEVPHKFEAGTPNIADVVAFSSTIEYIEELGMEAVRAHEMDLTRHAMAELRKIPSIRILGPEDPARRSGVVSFVDADLHPHDLSQILDQHGVAIRAGHHCAQPAMRFFKVVATARASFYIYNDLDDIEVLVEGIRTARRCFGYDQRS